MTKTPRTTPTTNTAVNDNSTMQVVYGVGRLRNYIMHRYNPEVPIRDEGDTGYVDMGKEGTFIGYAVLDPESNKFVFHKVRPALVETNAQQG